MACTVRSNRSRPLIGVTGPDSRLAAGRIAASLAVFRAGGKPLMLLPGKGRPEKELSGLVISGGSDINPTLYDSKADAWSPPDIERDEYELAMLQHAEQQALPVLGICRGAQLMNVFAGGNLYGDISELRWVTSNRSSILPSKWVDLEQDCRLQQMIGANSLKVNSLHHQAIKETGSNLQVVGRDRDDIIQAIEASGERFFIGVQWHPEYLQWKRDHYLIFKALVAAATGE